MSSGKGLSEVDHRDHGRSVSCVAYELAVKGGTFAFMTAARMHDSAGLPAAPPLTDADFTAPSDPKTMLTCVTASLPSMQAFAAMRAEPSAPWTWPMDGLSCFAAGPLLPLLVSDESPPS